MKLQETRLATGLSQSQLANKADVNLRMLQKYEQGEKILENAKIETLLKLCLALKCELKDIVDKSEMIDLLAKYEQNRPK